jgi:hypothetical protein
MSDPVLTNVLPLPDDGQGTWITYEEAMRAWAGKPPRAYESRPDGTVRELVFDQERDPKDEFRGFCDPCGGFRKHRLGCPVTRRPS